MELDSVVCARRIVCDFFLSWFFIWFDTIEARVWGRRRSGVNGGLGAGVWGLGVRSCGDGLN